MEVYMTHEEGRRMYWSKRCMNKDNNKEFNYLLENIWILATHFQDDRQNSY